MKTTSHAAGPAAFQPDPFFPSGRFARVPQEAFSALAFRGATGLSHAEFRVFVALARFRGIAKRVNPTRLTLGKMTGMTPNNISRATKGLQAKGWLTIVYVDGQKSRKVENYELKVPAAPQAVGAVKPAQTPPARAPERLALDDEADGESPSMDDPDATQDRDEGIWA